MAEESSVFRKKSIDRVNSPEVLNDYIKVANPTVWISLISIVIFLAGVCVWGAVGRIETCRDAVAVSSDGVTYIYVSDTLSEVNNGMPVRVNDFEGTVISVPFSPSRAEDVIDSYAVHLGNFTSNDYVFELKTDLVLPAGTYAAEIVIDSVSPMSFVFN